ncbi:hypothetical protein Droror1_Dr00023779 [Drosera rotundifolia]
MDSWKYLSDEKNMLLSEEVDCAVDGLGRYRSKVVGMGYLESGSGSAGEALGSGCAAGECSGRAAAALGTYREEARMAAVGDGFSS